MTILTYDFDFSDSKTNEPFLKYFSGSVLSMK